MNDIPTKRLEELVDFQGGLWTAKKEPRKTTRVLRNTNFRSTGLFDFSHVASIEVEEKQLAPRLLVQGDLLLERSGGGPTQPVGRVMYFDAEGEFSFSNFTTRMRVRSIKEIEPLFLWRYLNYLYDSGITEKLQKQTTGIRNLIFSDYKQIEIFVPPMEEQRKIVEKIEKQFAKFDEASRLRAESEALTDQLLPAALHEIFSARNNMSEIGSLCSLVNGRAFKSSEWQDQGKYPIIRIQNLNSRTKAFNYFSGVVNSRIVVHKGDLLFSWSGSRGTSFGPHIWYGETGLLNQHIFKVNHKENVDRQYFYYALKYLVAEVENTLHGGVGLVHITKTRLERLKIPLPPLAEQKEIVKKIDALAEKARALRDLQSSQSADLKALKQSILHEVFSAKI